MGWTRGGRGRRGQVAEAMGAGDPAGRGRHRRDIVNENMFGALRCVSVQQGYDPREFALVAFGGAGPLHANALGRLLGSWPVIIPPSPGVLCAYGDATTRVRNESARTFIRRFSETSNQEVERLLAELATEAAAVLDGDGVGRDQQSVLYQVDVRYHGQGFEVPVDVELDRFRDGGLEHVGQVFDAEHTRCSLRLTASTSWSPPPWCRAGHPGPAEEVRPAAPTRPPRPPAPPPSGRGRRARGGGTTGPAPGGNRVQARPSSRDDSTT